MNLSESRWLLYALASAGCAASINLFGKVGLRGVNPDVATAARSVVQAVFVVGFATAIGAWRHAGQLDRRAWTSVLLSGAMGGLSWVFVFRAIQLADVSKVAPIDKLSLPLGILLAVLLLHERVSATNWTGIILIAVGAYLAAIKG